MAVPATHDCDSRADYVVTPQGWVMRGNGDGSGDLTYKTHWFVQLFKTAGSRLPSSSVGARSRTEFEKVYLTDIAAAEGCGRCRRRERPEPVGRRTQALRLAGYL